MQNTSRCAEIERRFPGLLTAIVGALKIQSGEATVKAKAPKRKARFSA